MAAPQIKYASVDELLLDPTNPRLGRRVASPSLKQSEVLDVMRDWSPEELATSFIESGFWPQEALIAVEEKLYGKPALVVIEGNRRLAALKFLQSAFRGEPTAPKWREFINNSALDANFFAAIPYIQVSDRAAVAAYLGFRHVTGIKEWKPAEKAEYIAKLLEEEKLSYEQVRRKIGSKAPTVRQHYIAYRLLLQMDEQADIHMDAVEVKFSVLYLSLRTAGVQNYLGLNMQAEPSQAKKPVKKSYMQNLSRYATWLFGTEKIPPLFTDSRYVDVFGKILESPEAVDYLERTDNPRFEVAQRKSGAAEADVVAYVQGASDSIQLALSEAHVLRKSRLLEKAVRRLSEDALQLISIFPAVKAGVLKEWNE